MSEESPKAPDRTVSVRRQWNDWRTATYRLEDVSGFHWDDVSGGVNARSPRNFIHAYVWCDGMIEGELAHSCKHGQRPHHIKVCIVKKDNLDIFADLKALAGGDAPGVRLRAN